MHRSPPPQTSVVSFWRQMDKVVSLDQKGIPSPYENRTKCLADETWPLGWGLQTSKATHHPDLLPPTAYLLYACHRQCRHLCSQGLPPSTGICSCNTVPMGFPGAETATVPHQYPLLCLSHSDNFSPYSPLAQMDWNYLNAFSKNKGNY